MNIFNDAITNPDNQPILNEFIRYYKYIYTNQDVLNKSNDEIYYKLLNIKKIIALLKNYKNTIDENELVKLNKIKGVGPKTIQRIKEILETGELSEIKILQKKQNAINELTKIYGIGPKKALEFYKNNITTIPELIKSNVKLTSQQKTSLKYYDKTCDKIPHLEILKLEIKLHKLFVNIDNDYIVMICGSYRRKKNFSKDIDILITHRNLNSLNHCKETLDEAINILRKDYIIEALQTHGVNHFQGYAKLNELIVRTDIIVVPVQSLFTAMMHFTGSATFNEKIRGIAKSKSYKLNEYGLFKNKKSFTINSENDIFKKLGMAYVPPEERV